MFVAKLYMCFFNIGIYGYERNLNFYWYLIKRNANKLILIDWLNSPVIFDIFHINQFSIFFRENLLKSYINTFSIFSFSYMYFNGLNVAIYVVNNNIAVAGTIFFVGIMWGLSWWIVWRLTGGYQDNEFIESLVALALDKGFFFVRSSVRLSVCVWHYGVNKSQLTFARQCKIKATRKSIKRREKQSLQIIIYVHSPLAATSNVPERTGGKG